MFPASIVLLEDVRLVEAPAKFAGFWQDPTSPNRLPAERFRSHKHFQLGQFQLWVVRMKLLGAPSLDPC